jgi:putative FmdB family regulatory protein
MPIYEYQCSHCRYYLEVIQKITDAKLKKCPSCGRSTLQKLMSAPVFRLKGSGWYETDFKSDQEQKRNLAAAEKEPPAADSKGDKDSKDPKDAKDAKDSKETGSKDADAKGSKDAKDAKDAKDTRESKPEPAAKSAPGSDAKPVPKGGKAKSASRTRPAVRRPAAPARRTSRGKAGRRGSRR